MENFSVEQWVFTVFGATIFFGFIVPILNLIIASIPWKIKWFKLPKYKNKKSPIYKLTYYSYHGYVVEKYELKWRGLHIPKRESQEKEAWFGWIPFSGFFSFYRYILNDNIYGRFETKDIENGFFTNFMTLEKYYEMEDEQRIQKEEKQRLRLKEKESKIDKLNREFKENYC